MPRQKLLWRDEKTLPSRSFVCGHCGNTIASEKGYSAHYSGYANSTHGLILICHKCFCPTFFDDDERQVPDVTFGNPVQDITDKSVVGIYEEARKATGAGCYSLAVLACRKLLMHIAVAKGAQTGDNFVSYVEYLSDKNYIPPDARDWVDHIRTKGNEANHEIALMKKEDAEELLSFVEMLLKVIFEFPSQVKKKYGNKGASNPSVQATK